MQNLNIAQKSYWDAYVATLPQDEQPLTPFISASFAGNKEITDELLQLYLTGKKTAGSSVVEDFLTASDLLPEVGNFWIFLNSSETPSCILKTVEVKINKFNEVPADIAIAEGEGDLTLEYWRKVHSELYTPFLKNWGLARLEDATVITEFFEVVYK